MKSRSHRTPWTLVALLILATLACNFPGARDSEADSTPDAETTNTPLPFASATPSDDAAVVIPTVTPEEELEGDDCTFRAAFVDDVTVPDDTPVVASEAFDKTWRIRNSGTCVWEAGTTLIHVSGDDLSDIDTLTVPVTEPDQELELTVAMKAPAAPGTYRSNWQLQTPDSRRYGGVFYAQIVVP
ncbi:MAG: NBR1-Ig-like domain-containing protein, partial [Anaerolineae bacterium]|nr:NBR1-Ig-like domain-containing protein [Anaerolineae bacterium]